MKRAVTTSVAAMLASLSPRRRPPAHGRAQIRSPSMLQRR